MTSNTMTSLLNLKANPWSMGLGLALGMIIGLTPLLSLHNLIVLFIVLFFRVHLLSALFGFLLFSLLSPLFAQTMASLGESLLTNPGYQDLWTAFYNSALGPISQFNHTLTFGSLVLSLMLFPVVLVLGAYAAKRMVGNHKAKEA
ncbi:TIGR03546 family protein [Aliiglaciecola sp. CAU 1673]|uniref:TIGR03546 family protein n=1 Tax=Aliiglaciecola sp. CAU 1673 TaxID=3032595 RepID=UPI0023DC8D18|nr:TIGR03546 family protein [Aliiglaciecola sp. CAU 1673]MDF2178983.1 TIGR03546 family protein [Aliiglaciecola sp. CAU 1673]